MRHPKNMVEKPCNYCHCDIIVAEGCSYYDGLCDYCQEQLDLDNLKLEQHCKEIKNV